MHKILQNGSGKSWMLPVSTLAFLTFFFFTACNQTGKKENHQPDEHWISLFNGKDLTGWTPKFAKYDLQENFNNTFRAEDGILKVSYDEYELFDGEFGHLFYKDKFSHYRLKLEYRFLGEQTPGGPVWAFKNSGIMFHSQPPETMKKDQRFPVCVEAQFLGGNGKDDRPTMNLCTPGTRVMIGDTLSPGGCISSGSKTFHSEEWISAEILVLGDSLIRHFVNEEMVMEYKKTRIADAGDYPVPKDTPLKEGYIALQAESHPVEFRNIQLLNLLD